MTDKTTAALKLAEEALENYGIEGTKSVAGIKCTEALAALREALAEQEKQEPVAYRSRWKNTNGQVITGWVLHDNKPETPEARQETEPLYAAPVSAKMQADCTLADPKKAAIYIKRHIKLLENQSSDTNHVV